MRIFRPVILSLFSLAFAACANSQNLTSAKNDTYAVVVSNDTYGDREWKNVADTLVKKHRAKLVIFENGVENSREKLSALMPRYTAFVAQTKECGRDFVAEIHRLARRLDDDIFLDTQWGIITGATAKDALGVIQMTPPLTVKTALATTGLNGNLFDEFYLISDSTAGAWSWKKKNGTDESGNFGDEKNDVFSWAKFFENGAPDLIVSSAHGFENGVEMPFSRGIVRAVNGELFPVQNARQGKPANGTAAIKSTKNPKVYFPVGNCLVGHVNGTHCMVTTMMGAHGVRQMAGYTVDTWFGRGGWDMLGIWQALPGRNTFSESFFFNQQAMLDDIAALDKNALDYKIKLGTGAIHTDTHVRDMAAANLKFDPRLGRGAMNLVGLLWDIDTVAFYGDPAWRAVLNSQKEKPFLTTEISGKNGTYKLTVKILDANAAAKNGTPVGVIFSTRLKNPKILSGAEYKPVLADNFILLRNPKPQNGEREIIVEFTGEK